MDVGLLRFLMSVLYGRCLGFSGPAKGVDLCSYSMLQQHVAEG